MNDYTAKPLPKVHSNKKTNSVVKVSIPKRTVHIRVSLPNQQPYKIQFETKKEKKVTINVARLGNEKDYSPDTIFEPNKPYLLRINPAFEGDMIIDSVQGKKIRIPIHPSEEALTVVFENSPQKLVNKPFIEYKPKIEDTCIIEIGNKYFANLKDGTVQIAGSITNEFDRMMANDTFKSVVTGLMGDALQTVTKDRTKIMDAWKGLDVKFKTVNGKRYVILKGSVGLRSYYTGTRYLATNAKVSELTPEHYAKAPFRIVSMIKGNAIGIVIGSLFSTYDYYSKPEGQRDLTDLLGDIFTGVTKAVIGTIIGTFAAYAALALFTATAGWVILIGIGVGIIAGITLNYIDSKFGITKSLQKWINEEAQPWIEHEHHSFKRSFQLFFDLLNGTNKPFSAY